jgi:hypothetical protein
MIMRLNSRFLALLPSRFDIDRTKKRNGTSANIKFPILMGICLLFAVSNAHAAVKNQAVQYRLAILGDDGLIHQGRQQPFGFRVELVDDESGVLPEASQNGPPLVTATKGERYSVRLYNPLPVRVAVNLTVDGLNSITGKPSGISDGEKWMIEPYSSITIPGWQVSDGDARRFFFTEKPKSYAKWRGDETGKNLSANCGVIGAAYFWNQAELDQYWDDHPIDRVTQRPSIFYNAENRSCNRKSLNSLAQGAPACAPEPEKDMKKEEAEGQLAGTGMGESESHPTIQVAFNFDRGMYSPDQAVVIYYDFAKVTEPNPFPAEDYAPQMP